MKRTLLAVLLTGLWMVSGCYSFVFVTERPANGNLPQVYATSDDGSYITNLTDNNFQNRAPDVSPGGGSVAFASNLGGPTHNIYVKNLLGIGGPSPVTTGNTEKARPKWSPAGDYIAYTEDIGSGQHKILKIKSDGSGSPIQITAPPANATDSGGHALYDNGNSIVFSRRSSTTASYDLYIKKADATPAFQPLTATYNVDETTPTISHDGKLLAYVFSIRLLPGTFEWIQLVEVGTWRPLKRIELRPPIDTSGPSVRSLSFSKNNKALYFSAKAADVTGAEATKHEIFSVDIDTLAQTRLTTNSFADYSPSAIP